MMKGKQNATLSGWLSMIGKLVMFVLFLLMLAGCTPGAPAPAQPSLSPTAAATEVVPPTATVLPSPTATQPPTTTPEPSVTPTRQPTPTTTPLPVLAVLEGGFDAWCAPEQYAGTKSTSPDAPEYARKMATSGEQIIVPIPATYCALIYRFNQPAASGTTLTFYDGKNPFLKLPLQAADGHPEETWTTVTHSYVVNPPLWYVDYRLSVTGPDGKELWSNNVRFAKPLPKPCQFGGYPDPVTLYCTPTDPYEIEPWPDVKYPYPRNP